MSDATYDHGSKVYRKQGAAELVVASGGKIDLNSGASFYCVDTSFTADRLKFFVLSRETVSAIIASATVLSASQIDTTNGMLGYGHIVFSEPTGLSLASLTIPDSPQSGQMLYLDGARLVGDANISVLTSGASLINAFSLALSSFEISALGYCKMICPRAGQWAIVECNILEHAAA